MVGSPQVISALQSSIPLEAQLNLQYRLDERVMEFLGLKKLAEKSHEFGHDAHEWLKAITKRELELSGAIPTVDYTAGRVSDTADNPTGILQRALDMEGAICTQYESSIPVCVQALDDGTRNLFEHLVKWHQQHIVWLEKQLRLVKYLGESSYYSEKI